MQPPTLITDAFRIINYAEAGLWAVLGFGFALHALRSPNQRLPCLIAAVTLLAFGASDFIETRTGAWWRPWWLLAWKSACVLVLLALVIRWFRARRAA